MIRQLSKIQIDRSITCPHSGAHKNLFAAEEGKLELRLDDESGLVEIRSPANPGRGAVCIHRDRIWEIRFAEGASPFDSPKPKAR